MEGVLEVPDALLERPLEQVAMAVRRVGKATEKAAEAKAPPHPRLEPVEVGGGAPTRRPSSGARRTEHERGPSAP